MPKPSTSLAGRATVRARPRRLLHLLALTAVATAVAFPLAAYAPAGLVDGVAERAAADAAASARTSERPWTVTVIDGDTVVHGLTRTRARDEALDGLGIVRGPLDRVEVVPPVRSDGSITLRVVRVELERVEREVEVPQALITLEDPDLLRGSTEVVREGSSGLIIKTKIVRRVDGEIEDELVVARTTVRPAIDRIERVGTRETRGRDVWDALARCESNGRWSAVRVVNAELAYHGGLQFHPRTWNAFRPDGFPDVASLATRDQQIRVAKRVLAAQGWGAWPSCSKRLGLR
jgi:hypothetical protein